MCGHFIKAWSWAAWGLLLPGSSTTAASAGIGGWCPASPTSLHVVPSCFFTVFVINSDLVCELNGEDAMMQKQNNKVLEKTRIQMFTCQWIYSLRFRLMNWRRTQGADSYIAGEYILSGSPTYLRVNNEMA